MNSILEQIKQYLQGLDHIGIAICDIEPSINQFLALGFQKVWEGTIPNSSRRVCFLSTQNIVLELFESTSAPAGKGWIDHLAFNTTQLQTAFSICKESGEAFMTPEIMHLPFFTYGVDYFTIRLINGEKIEFCQHRNKN